MVPRVGLEPTLPKERDFKSLVYTNFTTAAQLFVMIWDIPSHIQIWDIFLDYEPQAWS